MFRLALFGQTLKYSYSQQFFNDKGRLLGVELLYELLELPSVQLLAERLHTHPLLHGANVTIPYKSAIIPYLHELTPTAQAIGAVNCLVRSGSGTWLGHNTDAEGLATDLLHWQQELGQPLPRQAILLGSGGAAKAAVYTFKQLGIETVALVCRVAGASPPQPGTRTVLYAELPTLLASIAEPLLLVNCTPVGTWPNVEAQLPLPFAQLGPNHWRYDMVYNPPETMFLRHGREAGAPTRNGLGMLHAQAEASWKVWFNDR